MKQNTTKHTPGPWKADEVSVYTNWPDSEGCSLLCTMFEDSTSYETAKANARLIASAPDMALELERVKALNAELVEALKGIKLLDVIDSIGLPSTAKNIIVDLIAKSEGRA